LVQGGASGCGRGSGHEAPGIWSSLSECFFGKPLKCRNFCYPDPAGNAQKLVTEEAMIQKNQFNNITWTAVAAMVAEAAMVATEISRKVWQFQGLHAAYGIMKKRFKKCGILIFFYL
jgi:hypothetical protein